MSHAWAHRSVSNMPKSVLVSLFPSRAQIVDIACGACGEGLAMVTESANGPLLTVWAPSPTTVPGGAELEPLWSMAGGPLPPETAISVHCFEHGIGVVDSAVLREHVDRYRAEGRRQRLPVEVRRATATRSNGRARSGGSRTR